MTVHVLMPVFNRLAMTQSMLAYLRAQVVDEPLELVVIDDGSTDGTGNFLKSQPDVTVLSGDGSLWWGGAIDLGLRHVLANAAADDWVLFVNNDTRIESGFVQALLSCARQHAPAAVGSAIRDTEPPHRLLSIGPRMDPWRMLVGDMLDTTPLDDGLARDAVPADALSGRGVLLPAAALRAVQGMRPNWLPHYLADYELALRVRSAGWRLLVCLSASVYSHEEYGNSFRGANLRERLFSARSPVYLPAQLRFWWSASNFWQKLSLPCRLVAFALFPGLRRKS
jgi:N-acetylglucosaminyl-diphospho-decaprenol L-rhamnosyltransferase